MRTVVLNTNIWEEKSKRNLGVNIAIKVLLQFLAHFKLTSTLQLDGWE